ncbi:hypothetical protein WG66_009216 [Moniliophthora roreri]|nr:hypothetical protein WG66_009216 [Moniliophthora roreri]
MVQIDIFEKSLYVSNVLGAIIYGLELYLAFTTIHLLVIDRSRRTRKQKLFYICYIISIVLVQTLGAVSNTALGYLMWLEHRDFPGGPMAYYTSSATSWNNFTGLVHRLLKLNMTAPAQYIGVVAILVESSLPFPVLGIIHAVLSAKGIGVYMAFAVFWGLYAGIAPILIIYRIAKGTAWPNDDNTVFSAVKFGTMRTTTDTATDSFFTRMDSELGDNTRLELYIAFTTIYLLIIDRSRRTRKQKIFYVSYIISIVLVQALAVASNTALGYLMWLEHRDFPGGPMAYYTGITTSWNNFTGISSIELTNFLGNLLSLYRCYVIWGRNIPVMILPVLMFLTASVMAIITLVQSAGTSIYSSQSVNYVVLWISITSSLNVLLTALISLRLLSARRRLLKLNITAPTHYIGVVAILVESSLPFPVLGILYAVLSAKNIGVYVIFAVFWGMYAGIAPLLIIYRVVKGTAWTNDDNNTVFSDVGITIRTTTITATDSIFTRTDNELEDNTRAIALKHLHLSHSSV